MTNERPSQFESIISDIKMECLEKQRTHLKAGRGVSLVSFPSDERDVALVWRAILPIVLQLSENFTGFQPKSPLKASPTAQMASIQSIGKYIFVINCTQHVSVEKLENQREEALLSKHPHTGYWCRQNGWPLRCTLLDWPLQSTHLG